MTSLNNPFDPNTQEEFDRLTAQFPEPTHMFVRESMVEAKSHPAYVFQSAGVEKTAFATEPNAQTDEVIQFPTGGVIKSGYKYVDIVETTLYQFVSREYNPFFVERPMLPPPPPMQIESGLSPEYVADIFGKLLDILDKIIIEGIQNETE